MGQKTAVDDLVPRFYPMWEGERGTKVTRRQLVIFRLYSWEAEGRDFVRRFAKVGGHKEPIWRASVSTWSSNQSTRQAVAGTDSCLELRVSVDKYSGSAKLQLFLDLPDPSADDSGKPLKSIRGFIDHRMEGNADVKVNIHAIEGDETHKAEVNALNSKTTTTSSSRQQTRPRSPHKTLLPPLAQWLRRQPACSRRGSTIYASLLVTRMLSTATAMQCSPNLLAEADGTGAEAPSGGGVSSSGWQKGADFTREFSEGSD